MGDFNIDGLWLVLITLLFFIIIIFSYPFVKKYTNNYFFWLVISIGWIIYAIFFRFLKDWTNYANTVNNNILLNPSDYNSSIIISKALLLDFCPFFALAIPFTLIIDPSRKIASILSPLSLFGGLITLVQIPFDPSASLTAQYIFLGVDPNKIYFIMHFINCIIAILVMLNTPKIKINGFLWLNVFAICYFLYISIIMQTTGVDWNVSGLSSNDWIYGEYYGFSQILNLSFPFSMIIGYILCYLSTCMIIMINDLGIKRIKSYSYLEQKNNLINYYKFN